MSEFGDLLDDDFEPVPPPQNRRLEEELRKSKDENRALLSEISSLREQLATETIGNIDMTYMRERPVLQIKYQWISRKMRKQLDTLFQKPPEPDELLDKNAPRKRKKLHISTKADANTAVKEALLDGKGEHDEEKEKEKNMENKTEIKLEIDESDKKEDNQEGTSDLKKPSESGEDKKEDSSGGDKDKDEDDEEGEISESDDEMKGDSNGKEKSDESKIQSDTKSSRGDGEDSDMDEGSDKEKVEEEVDDDSPHPELNDLKGHIQYFETFCLDRYGARNLDMLKFRQGTEVDLFHVPAYEEPVNHFAPLPLYKREETKDGIEGRKLLNIDFNFCFNCGEKGHSIRDCPEDKDEMCVQINSRNKRQYGHLIASRKRERFDSRYHSEDLSAVPVYEEQSNIRVVDDVTDDDITKENRKLRKEKKNAPQEAPNQPNQQNQQNLAARPTPTQRFVTGIPISQRQEHLQRSQALHSAPAPALAPSHHYQHQHQQQQHHRQHPQQHHSQHPQPYHSQHSQPHHSQQASHHLLSPSSSHHQHRHQYPPAPPRNLPPTPPAPAGSAYTHRRADAYNPYAPPSYNPPSRSPPSRYHR